MADKEFRAPDLERRKILAVLEREILSLDEVSWKPFMVKNGEEKNRNPPEGNRVIWQTTLRLEIRRSVPNIIFLPSFAGRYKKNSEEKNWNPRKEVD